MSQFEIQSKKQEYDQETWLRLHDILAGLVKLINGYTTIFKAVPTDLEVFRNAVAGEVFFGELNEFKADVAECALGALP